MVCSMAMIVVATVPSLPVYPFLGQYCARGVLSGAIKGDGNRSSDEVWRVAIRGWGGRHPA